MSLYVPPATFYNVRIGGFGGPCRDGFEFRHEVYPLREMLLLPWGWHWLAWDTKPEENIQAVAIPFWIPALLLAAVIVRGARSRCRLARVREGLCVKCGYDLRATPERCPECGTVVV